MANSSLTFLPWLRKGLGAGKAVFKGSIRGSAEISMQMTNSAGDIYPNTPVSHEFLLRGPGDVLGFSPAAVERTEPKNGEEDFENNYFPYIIFKDADFPWRYSPENADENGRLKPWIILLVLKNNEFELSRRTLKVKINNVNLLPLPDLNQSHAWAHVQLAGDVPVNIQEYINAHPELCCSRLMCPRKLEPGIRYTAFVVPAYEVGRKAGLGIDLDTKDLITTAAWTKGIDKEIVLPIYYQWSFKTADNLGDFEVLVNKIHSGVVPTRSDGSSMGTRKINCFQPGLIMDQDNQSQEKQYENDNDMEVLLEGALVPPGFNHLPISPVGFTVDIQSELKRALEESSPGDDEDPLVAIPVYGRYYRNTIAIDSNQILTGNFPWVNELNLDRRERISASFGTSVVQYNQEEYMQECWEQVGAIREANERLRLAAVSSLINKSLKDRHFVPLDDERFTLLTQPFHHYYLGGINKNQKSYKSLLQESGLPRASLSPSFMRIANQKIGMVKMKPSVYWNSFSKSEAEKKEKINRTPSLGRIPLSQIKFNDALTDVLKVKAKIDLTKEFQAIYPLKPEVVQTDPPDIQNLRDCMDMNKDLLGRLNSTIKVPWLAELRNFDQIMIAPKIDLPMYKHLCEKSVDMMVPGLDLLDNNTLVLLEENRKFIEAYLVGINHEMGRELEWREYPTDKRGTVFSYFWDPPEVDDPPADIAEIHTWGGVLGLHPGTQEILAARLVLAIRAVLIRRYPDTIFFVLKKKKSDQTWTNVLNELDGGNSIGDAFQKYNPAFSARVGRDIMFIGFSFTLAEITADKVYDYFFIIMEHPSLPRFGLDMEVDDPEFGRISLDKFSWNHVNLNETSGWIDPVNLKTPEPPNPKITLYEVKVTDNDESTTVDWNWDTDSAGKAYITYQKPVRAIISINDLLNKK